MPRSPKPAANSQLTVLDTGKIAAYKESVRCRILEVRMRVTFTGVRASSVLVNFGGGVPFMRVKPADLRILPGETQITPKRSE